MLDAVSVNMGGCGSGEQPPPQQNCPLLYLVLGFSGQSQAWNTEVTVVSAVMMQEQVT